MVNLQCPGTLSPQTIDFQTTTSQVMSLLTRIVQFLTCIYFTCIICFVIMLKCVLAVNKTVKEELNVLLTLI